MPKQLIKIDLEALEKGYQEYTPLWNRLSIEIRRQLDYLLDQSSIQPTFPIQTRIKKWESIVNKLGRVSLSLKNIKDIQDILGFRLVLQFQRDADKISASIENTFKVIKKYNTTDRLKDDQFGYSSLHFIVELPEEWLAVPAMKELGGLMAEIQIRTTAQHIWAEASQTLQYKNEASVPPSIRRAIYRVSAVLEIVDLELERVLTERDEYRIEINKLKNPNEPLNVDIINQILDKVWPEERKQENQESYSMLLIELIFFKVNTKKQLEELLNKHKENVFKKERDVLLEPSMIEINKLLKKTDLSLNHTGLTRYALRLEFGKAYDDFISKTTLPIPERPPKKPDK